LYEGGPCYIGNDIAAGGGDLWVAWVWEQVGDVLWCREIVPLRREKFAVQDAVMDDLFQRYRVIRLAMDQTGMGEKPVEDAKRRYGSSRVEGVQFTGPAKLVLATQGKTGFEDRKVRIPEGQLPLRADLHSLVKIVGPTGNVRFLAPREGGSHADRTWAAFLGVHAADTGGVEYDYEPATSGGDRHHGDARRPDHSDDWRRQRGSGLRRLEGTW
jgi:phage FluMu gp28-like protein